MKRNKKVTLAQVSLQSHIFG